MSAYHIEIDEQGCSCCGYGKTWIIIAPNDVALGTSFGDHADAIDLCDNLNDAYNLGHEDGVHAALIE